MVTSYFIDGDCGMEKEKLISLVIQAQESDQQALNDLFTKTYNDVYYFALKTVKDEALAADITQETFITIFQNIHGLNDPAAYPAWSRQITYRHCLQYIKKQDREIVVEEDEDGNSIFDTVQEDKTEFIPDEALDKEDFRNTILKMVDGLPEEQRTAIILYYYDELSVRQIAEIQGVTEGTVKSRLNYGRKAIKSSVETYEKKNNVKLHSFALLPLLLWLFSNEASACSMSATAAQTVAEGVATATGTTLSLPTAITKGAKAVWSLWQKIVAAIAATAIAVGGGFAIADMNSKAEPPVWSGAGKVNIGLNLSSENEFILTVEEMDENSISGSLTVNVADGTIYQTSFTGKGEKGTDLFVGSIFYEVQLDKEVEGWLKEYPGYTELTLQYHPEEDYFLFWNGPFEAELKKEK